MTLEYFGRGNRHGEVRRITCREGGNRFSSIPWRRKYRISCARSIAKVGIKTLPCRANVAPTASYSSSSEASNGLWSWSP